MTYSVHSEPFDILPLWLLFILATVSLAIAMEGGYRLGRWRHEKIPGEKELPVGAMVASILGLVALVLGFTFSLAASRFDARRLAVLEESNAIGTTYLRARLLPEPEKTAVSKLLREYVAARVEATQQYEPASSLLKSEALHELLWRQAVAAAEKNPDSIMTGIFIQSLNDVIDLHAKRILVGLRSRIPLIIWLGLFGLSLLGMVAVGYQCGLSATQRSPAMIGFVVAFAIVLYLIADLDRGREGLLRVGQQSMLDLQKSMQAEN